MLLEEEDTADEIVITQAIRILRAFRDLGEPDEVGPVQAAAIDFLIRQGVPREEIERRIEEAGPIERPRLRLWSVVVHEGAHCLAGVVEGHPLVRDGRTAVTSPVIVRVPSMGVAVTASGRIYELLESLADHLADGSELEEDAWPSPPTRH